MIALGLWGELSAKTEIRRDRCWLASCDVAATHRQWVLCIHWERVGAHHYPNRVAHAHSGQCSRAKLKRRHGTR